MGSFRNEDGFTLVELLAACLLLAVGVLGVVGSLDLSRTAVSRAEVREAATHRGERELERLRALPYAQLALTVAPGPSGAPADPDSFVRPGAKYQWDPGDAAKVSDMVVGGGVAPQTAWADGRHRGKVHAYVLRYDDAAVTGPIGARRVVVAVTVDGPWSLPRPMFFSTIVHDPAGNPT